MKHLEVAQSKARPSIILGIALVFLCLGWILTTNSMPALYLLPERSLFRWLQTAIALLELGIVLVLWQRKPIDRCVLHRWFVWAAFVLIAYCACWFANAEAGGHPFVILVGTVALLPLLFVELRQREVLGWLLLTFVNLVALLASASLVLWVLGPITHLIVPNCTVVSTWSSFEGGAAIVPGYYWLLFESQHILFHGTELVRNCGIFAEAPMYSYVLSAALLIEVCLRDRVRMPVIIILVATVLTTFSTTGLVLSFWVIGGGILVPWCKQTWERLELKRIGRIVFVVAAILVLSGGAAVVIHFIITKLATSGSGGERLDCLHAGFLAWLQRPVFGHGFSAERAIDALRAIGAGSVGLSNSLATVLALGGLVYFSTYIVQLVGFFSVRSWKKAVYALGLFFIWSVTVTYTLPINVFLFGMGVAELICGTGCRKEMPECINGEIETCGESSICSMEAIDLAALIKQGLKNWPVIVVSCILAGAGMFAVYPSLVHNYRATVHLELTGEPVGGSKSDYYNALILMLGRSDTTMSAIRQTKDQDFGRYIFSSVSDYDSFCIDYNVEAPSQESAVVVANYMAESIIDQYAQTYPDSQSNVECTYAKGALLIDDRTLYTAASIAVNLVVGCAILLTRAHDVTSS